MPECFPKKHKNKKRNRKPYSELNRFIIFLGEGNFICRVEFFHASNTLFMTIINRIASQDVGTLLSKFCKCYLVWQVELFIYDSRFQDKVFTQGCPDGPHSLMLVKSENLFQLWSEGDVTTVKRAMNGITSLEDPRERNKKYGQSRKFRKVLRKLWRAGASRMKLCPNCEFLLGRPVLESDL